MLILELLFVGMLLLRVVVRLVRALVRLHVALIVVALPAGLLVRAGVIEDVGAFAVASCTWAAVLLAGWAVRARRRPPADKSPAPRHGQFHPPARPTSG